MCYHVRSSSLCTLHSSSQVHSVQQRRATSCQAKNHTTSCSIFPVGALNHHSSNLNALKHSFKLNHLRGIDLYLFTFPSGATPGNPSVRIFLQPHKTLSRFRFVQILASPRSSLQHASEMFSTGFHSSMSGHCYGDRCCRCMYVFVDLQHNSYTADLAVFVVCFWCDLQLMPTYDLGLCFLSPLHRDVMITTTVC